MSINPVVFVGMYMEKNNEMNIRIQIDKDYNSGDFRINIFFNKDAPNLKVDKEYINWCPTDQEIEFLLETYDMIEKRKNSLSAKQHTVERHSKNLVEDPNQKENAEFESIETTEEDEVTIPNNNNKKNEEKIFIQADHETIDKILEKKKDDQEDSYAAEADDQSIIDKVLKQNIKKKDKREY